MRHEPVPHDDLIKARDGKRYKGYSLRLHAVTAEIGEQEKEHRDITQVLLAEFFGVDPKTLRTWVDWYREHGLEGLRALGGQGRKPDLSREQVQAAIKKAQESGGPRSTAEDEADNCAACREEAEENRAKAAGEKRPSRRAPPRACRCKLKGVKCKRGLRGCKCKKGRACKCKCCRDPTPPPKGPRHARGCPRARRLPNGAITVAILRAVLFEDFGKMYSDSRLYVIMAMHGLVSKRLSPVHINHASIAAVRAWQRRLEVRLKKLRDAGYAIASFDECFLVRDKAAGRMWIEAGKEIMQIYTGSRERIALFGYYFEDRTHRFHEYAFADTNSLIESLKRVAAEYGRVAIIMDRMSAHSSKDLKKFLREYRRDHPGRDIQLIYLPRGSPYLNVVEECWGMLKKAVAQYYYYPRFKDLRNAAMEYLQTTRFRMDMEDFLYRNPRLHLPSN